MKKGKRIDRHIIHILDLNIKNIKKLTFETLRDKNSTGKVIKKVWDKLDCKLDYLWRLMGKNIKI